MSLIIEAISSGAADLYIRAAALAIGPVLGAAVYAVAMIGVPR
jgi:hypothetical protein